MHGTCNFQKLPNYFNARANTTGDGMLGRGFPGYFFLDRGRANATKQLDLLMPGQLGGSSRDIASPLYDLHGRSDASHPVHGESGLQTVGADKAADSKSLMGSLVMGTFASPNSNVIRTLPSQNETAAAREPTAHSAEYEGVAPRLRAVSPEPIGVAPRPSADSQHASAESTRNTENQNFHEKLSTSNREFSSRTPPKFSDQTKLERD